MSQTVLLSLIFFIGMFSLGALNTVLKRLKKRDSKKQLRQTGPLFFYRALSKKIFPSDEEGALRFCTTIALNICRFLTIFFLALNYEAIGLLAWNVYEQIAVLFLLIFTLYGFGEFLPKYWTLRFPSTLLWILAPLSSFFLTLSLPITVLAYKAASLMGAHSYLGINKEPIGALKQELIELIQESESGPSSEQHDQKLIESVVRFRTKIAREVMVPRIDVFALNEKTTIKEAAKALLSEGYSRIPVYKGTIDEVSGILMYRDLLGKCMEAINSKEPEKILLTPIQTVLRGALFTPETKKISQLLQEFKKKQTHLAIVVDEYGGTAGIVTIEDLLEEIVGDIEDEYDREEDLFTPLSDGIWIADGRLSLIDAYEQLGIELPQEGEYDTIGGFLFHRAGAIPSKGFKILLDTVELEVMKSNDRRVEKVKIKRRTDGHE